MTNWLIIGIVVAVIVSLLAVLTVIYLIKKRYKIAILLAVAMLFLTLIVIFAIGMIAGKVTTKLYGHVKSVITEEQKHNRNRLIQIEQLKAMTPPILVAQAPPNFYTYDGYWDWWRIPLIYPYSLQVIDSLESSANICLHKGGPVEDPNKSVEYLPYDIIRYTFDSHWLLFQFKNGKEWGLLNFATGRSNIFQSEETLFVEAKQKGFSGKNYLRTIKEGYNWYFFPE